MQRAGCTEVVCSIEAHDKVGLRFSEEKGFAVVTEFIRYDTNCLTALMDDGMAQVQRTKQAGVTFERLSPIPKGEEFRHELYDVALLIYCDIPETSEEMSFRSFLTMLSDNERFKKTAVVTASIHGRCIGFELLQVDTMDNVLVGTIMGVLTEHRGKGIARALRTLSMAYAQQCRVPKLRGFSTASNTRQAALVLGMGAEARVSSYQLKQTLPAHEESLIRG